MASKKEKQPALPSRPAADLTWLKKLIEQGIAGVLLLALAVVTLIGLLYRTGGTVIDWWSHLILIMVGWGSYVVVLMVALVGILLSIGKIPRLQDISWHALVGGEIVALALLGLIHLILFRDDPWTAAQQGQGGGYVGAVFSGLLNDLLGPWLTGLILALVLLGGLVIASGQSVQEWLEQIEETVAVSRSAAPPSANKALVKDPPTASFTEPANNQTTAAPPAPTPRLEKPAAVQAAVTPKPKRSRALRIEMPPTSLLDEPPTVSADLEAAQRRARIIENTLAQFGVPAQVVETNWGPRVTQFGVEPGFVTRKGVDGEETERKIRVSKIASLSSDLALALAASPIRIEAPVPGRSIVGIEVPNEELSVVSLGKIISSRSFRRKTPLMLALGAGVAGHAVVADLSKMPHLLIAGATGSGKSACINALIVGLLFQNSPLTLRLILVDPKRVELTAYDGLPHLYGNVQVDVEHVVVMLRWLLNEMQERYKKLADLNARHIDDYNSHWQVGSSEYMPRIVVFIDELADLMFFAPEEVEKSICRLAQMARATGIHLVMATQRPSVDVVTGLIKANFPARIGFAVSTGTDSRVILDAVGAETLLGKGDMLFMSPESSKLQRIQGVWVTEHEIAGVVDYWKQWAVQEEWEAEPAPWNDLLNQAQTPCDELLDQAIEIVRQHGSASASMLQRRMRIGYPRAASLIDQMEQMGVIGPAEGGGKNRPLIGLQSEMTALPEQRRSSA